MCLEAFVMNLKRVLEVLWSREDARWRRIVHAAQRGNLITERLLHPDAYECEKNRGIWRLNKDIRADALDAFSPFGNDAGWEAYNNQNENYLDCYGNHTQRTEHSPGPNTAPELLQQ